MSIRLGLSLPHKSILLSVAGCFGAAHTLHFCTLFFCEFLFSSTERVFFFDWYSALLGFAIGFEINSLLAGAVVFLSLIFLGQHGVQWFRLSKLLCALIPFGPLFDVVFDRLNWYKFKPYQNLFMSELSALERFKAALSPGIAEDVVFITLGHRVLFVLISIASAFFVLHFTRNILRTFAMLFFSYVSLCTILAFLSPSDIPPMLIFQSMMLLPIVIWTGNAFFIARFEFISRQESLASLQSLRPRL